MPDLILSHKGHSFPVTVRKARRGSRRLRLSVTPEGDIRLSVPARTSDRQIQQFLASSESWLGGQLDRLLAILPARNALIYEDAAQHPYLGEEITLHLQSASRRKTDFQDGILHLSLPDPKDSEQVKAGLEGWYRQQSLRVLPERLQAILPRTPWVQTPPEIKIRRMKRQWGNCARHGGLTFNLHLIKAAPVLIDHVIIHELCHLAEFNHSPRFYALMARADSDWRTNKAQLDRLAPVLIY